MSKVTVIDYGIGNLLSVKRAFEYCGAEVLVSSDINDILKAERLVLPGVGAFKDGMKELGNGGFIPYIKKYCESNRSFLGICLGMQMMADESEEFGVHRGLGIIHGKVEKILDVDLQGNKQKVPHVGWNELVLPKDKEQNFWNDTILNGIKEKNSMYFVHSYMFVPNEKDSEVASCNYGGRDICSVVKKGNVYGCQFHPEKSSNAGLEIIKNFLSF